MMDIRTKQRAVVDALEDIKGRDIVVYNTAAMPSMFERVVIASGDSSRQVKALSDNVREKLEALGQRVYGVEGEKSGEWVLVDLGDVVVHIMHPAAREFYNLEEVWGDKPVKFKAPEPKKPVKPKSKPAKSKVAKSTPAKSRPAKSKPKASKPAKPKPRAKAARSRRK
jgi:ribosome-associated protein